MWLKSGGYLVIEHIKAMVVIDVNTDKYSGKKNQGSRWPGLEAVVLALLFTAWGNRA